VLISIDLSNSQPYLSTILFNKEFYIPGSKINLTKLNLVALGKAEIRKITKAVYIILEEVENNPSILGLKKFSKIAIEGQIYEHFQKLYEQEFGVPIERKKVKRGILKTFFGEHELIGGSSTKIKKLFKKEFPTVDSIFGCIKKEEKNRLAIILQRVESKLIIEKICRQIRKINPLIPLITIHDSIVTTAEFHELVYEIMSDVFKEYIGYPPKLKIEKWHPQQLLNTDASLLIEEG
jgi:hypothetical protein